MTGIDNVHRQLHEQTDRHMEAVARILQRTLVAEHLVENSRLEDLKGLGEFESKVTKAIYCWQTAIKDANDKGEGDEVPTNFTVARDLNNMDVH